MTRKQIMTDFKILSDRDHILMRPQMYIGSISEEPINMIVDFEYQEVKVVPGLLKIINEIIDEAQSQPEITEEPNYEEALAAAKAAC